MTPYEIEKNNFKRYFITQNRMQNAFNDFKNKYLRIVFLYSYSCLLLFFKVENLEIVLSYLKRNLLRKLDSSGQILQKNQKSKPITKKCVLFLYTGFFSIN